MREIVEKLVKEAATREGAASTDTAEECAEQTLSVIERHMGISVDFAATVAQSNAKLREENEALKLSVSHLLKSLISHPLIGPALVELMQPILVQMNRAVSDVSTIMHELAFTSESDKPTNQ